MLVKGKTGCLGSLRVPFPEITKLSHIGIMGFPMTRAETAALEPSGLEGYELSRNGLRGGRLSGLEFYARSRKILKRVIPSMFDFF